MPLVFKFRQNKAGTERLLEDNYSITLKGSRVIFNPGSVGQPRDQNPFASYGIYDTNRNRLILHRVSYDISFVQNRMRKQGFQSKFIDRLAFGI